MDFKAKIAGVPRPKASPSLPPLPAEEPTNPGAPVTNARHKRDMQRSSIFTFLTVILGGALFSPGCLDIGTRLIGQKGRLDHVEAHVATIEKVQATQGSELTETRTDIRSLYKAWIDNKRQDRLEAPAPAIAHPIPTDEPLDGGSTP